MEFPGRARSLRWGVLEGKRRHETRAIIHAVYIAIFTNGLRLLA
jgi:hypothetical protein